MMFSTMRTLIALNLLCSVTGFVVPGKNTGRVQSRFSVDNMVVMHESTTVSDFASDFGSAMPKQVSPYEKIGIAEDQLALGINPEDVVAYVGT